MTDEQKKIHDQKLQEHQELQELFDYLDKAQYQRDVVTMTSNTQDHQDFIPGIINNCWAHLKCFEIKCAEPLPANMNLDHDYHVHLSINSKKIILNCKIDQIDGDLIYLKLMVTSPIANLESLESLDTRAKKRNNLESQEIKTLSLALDPKKYPQKITLHLKILDISIDGASFLALPEDLFYIKEGDRHSISKFAHVTPPSAIGCSIVYIRPHYNKDQITNQNTDRHTDQLTNQMHKVGTFRVGIKFDFSVSTDIIKIFQNDHKN